MVQWYIGTMVQWVTVPVFVCGMLHIFNGGKAAGDSGILVEVLYHCLTNIKIIGITCSLEEGRGRGREGEREREGGGREEERGGGEEEVGGE